MAGWLVTVGRVSVTVMSVADGLADAWKADLNWKLQISNNQCGLDWGRSSANICAIILKREDAFGLPYLFFREPNVAYFTMKHTTDTESDSRLPIHQHETTQKLYGIQLLWPSIKRTMLKCVSV